MTSAEQGKAFLGAAGTWGVAGSTYDRFSAHFADALSHCVQRLAPKPGERVLDVATGTGWSARLAALRGARVTGLDYSETLIHSAREIAEGQGLHITFDVGDAQALPYADGQFDGVMSTFGVIFAGDPVLAAHELGRVCRSGGRIALAVWAREGSVSTLGREVLSKFSPRTTDAVPPSPYEWGSQVRLQDLLGADFELQFEEASTVLREPDGEAVWELWQDTHGPTVSRLSHLDEATIADYKRAFVAFHERYRTDCGISMPREYLVVLGTRK